MRLVDGSVENNHASGVARLVFVFGCSVKTARTGLRDPGDDSGRPNGAPLIDVFFIRGLGASPGAHPAPAP